MTKTERILWSSYTRMPNNRIAEKLGISEEEVYKQVRKVGWKYFGNHWRQLLMEQVSDEEFRKEFPPRVIRARCAAVRATWDEKTELARRMYKNPKTYLEEQSDGLGRYLKVTSSPDLD